MLLEYITRVREITGYEVPIAADHFGHFDLNTAIQVWARQLTNSGLPGSRTSFLVLYDQWKEISHAIETPTLTGEDVYLKENS
jgi:hypothetical protein